MNAYLTDTGYPPRNSTDEARIVIDITRNTGTPVFSNTQYQATISETLLVGSGVLVVNANDQDQAVRFFCQLYSILLF